MIRFVCCGVLLAAVFVGACATTPAETAGGGTIQPGSTVAAEPASGAAIAPGRTVDLNQLAQMPTVICRDILKQGSNVLVRQCMTVADWKTYERQEAQAAAELVRMMQGGRYR